MITRRSLLAGTLATSLVTVLKTPGMAQTSDTMTWGEDFDLDTLDPRVSQSRHEAQMIDQMFESLLFLDTDGKVYPWLAERWVYAKDGKSITFYLRKDVKFHDGTPFNAKAVKFTFDSIVDPKLASQAAIDTLGPYQSTEVIDDYTAKVNWASSYGSALTNLSNPWLLSIVSPAAVAKLGNDGFARNPVGTGPFKFVEWISRQQVVMERNDDYRWAPKAFRHQGPAKIRRLVNRIITDSSTRVSAFERGEINVCDNVPVINVQRFRQNSDFGIMIGDVAGIPLSYMPNTSIPPFNDLRVRRAFIMAINRPAVAQQVYFGATKAGFGPLTPTVPGYWSGVEHMYPFDLAKAQQLLGAAGWNPGPDGIRVKNGQPLVVTFVSTLEPDLGVAVQAAVKQAGFQMNIQRVTQPTRDELILSNRYNLVDLRWVALDPSILKIPFASSNIPAPGKLKFNWSRFSSPEVDRLLKASDEETNVQKRNKILTNIQQIVMEQAVIVPLIVSINPIGYRRQVQGLKFVQGFWQVYFYDAAAG